MWNIFKEIWIRNKIRKHTANIDKLSKKRQALKAKQLKETAARESYVVSLAKIQEQ